MIVFPNCKINLGLNIVRKRADNFHDLETVFFPIALKDILEIIPSNKLEFFISGINIPGNTNDNLCLKAYHLLKKDFPNLPLIKIYLHKAIPTGAGLGGGSADGAFMLKLLNEKFQLNLSNNQLINYSLQLGSDCPFFIINKPCFATSRGEILEEIKLDLSNYSFVLINPKIHINTAWAFSQLTPQIPSTSVREIINQPIEKWKQFLKNDFENAVLIKYPSLKIIKETLYNSGALYASMSGSGSSFYGIFEKNNLPQITFEENFEVVYLP
jgi:4-diphosphocytidyl-2-C-methyl-D-erythritol kinase